MGKKKIEQDLRDAGLRKKRARKVAKAADRGRSGDRAARALVERHAATLRGSISAVVRHAKPPKSRSVQKASAKKAPAKKAPAKKSSVKTASAKKVPVKSTPAKRASAARSTSKSTARRHRQGKPATRKARA